MSLSPKQQLTPQLVYGEPAHALIITDKYDSGKFFLDDFVKDINPRNIHYRSNYTVRFRSGSSIAVRSLKDLEETTKGQTFNYFLLDYYTSPTTTLARIHLLGIHTPKSHFFIFRDRDLIDPETFDIGWGDEPV